MKRLLRCAGLLLLTLLSGFAHAGGQEILTCDFVLKVDRGGDARLGGKQILCRACRRREERHLSVRGGRGDSARMNGKCQMTSPIPGLT